MNLADAQLWDNQKEDANIGHFLIKYLRSPYSTKTPLIILGHPGSGKSILTKMIAAIFSHNNLFIPIRVPLRKVNTDCEISEQIIEQLNKSLGTKFPSWNDLRNQNTVPLLVLLDGYDELLQASGRMFKRYIKDIENFQKKEESFGNQLRVIVTSRFNLIDKAVIPLGATVIRLLEFNEAQRNKWIDIWNNSNADYFRTAKPEVTPFILPKESDNVHQVLTLAKQPLLLLMLALYDSQHNSLKDSMKIDRTVLYNNLLRRFIKRELLKDRAFRETSDEKNQENKINSEMERLRIVALGMYNRRATYIHAMDLQNDMKYHANSYVGQNSNREDIYDMQLMTQAYKLLGSFFFVHKAKSKQDSKENSSFEFLHNTFGEFLTADFILQHTVNMIRVLIKQHRDRDLQVEYHKKLGAPNMFPEHWFSALVYTPLFTRPVVIEMLREWASHVINENKISMPDFLEYLETIIEYQIGRILNQQEMESMLVGMKETPYGKIPMLGHMSIYSLNLIILRAVLGTDSYIFCEDKFDKNKNDCLCKEEGKKAWNRLTYLWRSWFPLDILKELTAIFTAEREDSKVIISPKKKFAATPNQDKMETILEVGMTLADNITTSMSGLLLYNTNKKPIIGLDKIERYLSSEHMNNRLQLIFRILLYNLNSNNEMDKNKIIEYLHEAFRLLQTSKTDSMVLYRYIYKSYNDRYNIGLLSIDSIVLGALLGTTGIKQSSIVECIRLVREVVDIRGKIILMRDLLDLWCRNSFQH
ncbi:MAG: NACHT domain-containing protein, partial [Candidatus Magnetominusculus sp. LBB02]|nr:NACHT domain-containing protein [Candidatus Magnetominusculus sp. LBB02]